MDVFAPQIGAYALVVYLVLARACYGNTATVNLSLRQIEKQYPGVLSRSTIARSLDVLEAGGLLQLIHGATRSAPAEYGLVSLKKLADSQTPLQVEAARQMLDRLPVPNRDTYRKKKGSSK